MYKLLKIYFGVKVLNSISFIEIFNKRKDSQLMYKTTLIKRCYSLIKQKGTDRIMVRGKQIIIQT